MEQELRHGKYTKDEYVNKVMDQLLSFEKEIINKGLAFLDLKLKDFLFHEDISDVKFKENKLNVLSVNENALARRINEKGAQVSNAEEAKVFYDFFNILPNVISICSNLSIEENELKVVLSGYESILNSKQAFRSRYNQKKAVIEEKFEKYREDYQFYKSLDINLKWNGDQKVLANISTKLFENETTNAKNDFVNAIINGEKCIINIKRKDFFVILFYRLAGSENPLVVTDKKGGNGAIGAAHRFFSLKLKTKLQSISLPDQMKRINKKKLQKDENLKKIDEEVDSFLKEFLL